MSLFEKAAVFTDIHFGLKNNSTTHNEDCVDFIKWFCNLAKDRGCETALFLGDWHHHRNTINVSTLNYTHQGLKLLNENFKQVYIITGNHDLYYREKRDVHSMPMSELYPNITLVDEVLIKDEVAIVPWLVADEWKKIRNIDCKYMFGHFELPGFKLNAMVEMPDHGGLNRTHFKKPEYVFTGHFHKRQYGQNVHYIGNPFGHSYADAWDFERGAMILEWDKKPEYVDWDEGPRYMTLDLSKLIDNSNELLIPKAHLKVNVDIELSYEEIAYIKETFGEQFDIRELIFIQTRDTEHEQETDLDVEFQSVDHVVMKQLSNLDSKEYDINKLIEIYNEL